ncbi:MAG: DUF2341 domain-containing protein [Candidatus Paceibacterota bacterium]
MVTANGTDVRFWNSSFASTSLPGTSSIYSQDHAAVDGSLYVYGNFINGTTTEYWNYANDFDGSVLTGGSRRAVTVSFATSTASTLTMSGGVLQLLGDSTATTTVQSVGNGTYVMTVTGGVFNADEYAFRDLASGGLTFTGTPTITSLSNGDFEQTADSVTLITLASTTLDTNASLIIDGMRFANGGFVSGTNVALDATTTNSWSFTNHRGNIAGEDYDADGTDECSSLRWEDSQCLLTEQTHYRWRNDDGGEGAPDSSWYDTNWSARQRVRIINDDATAYASTAVKMTVAYDADMQSDFEDLRFTDSTGTTTIPFWVERFSTGVSAQVWVQTPLVAEDVTEVFMYYGNVTATSTSDVSLVFDVYDDFEDGDDIEYAGDIGLFSQDGDFAYGGGYGVDTEGFVSNRATDGMFRTDQTISQGQIIRYLHYVDTTAGAADEACVLFGVQSPGTDNNNYGVCLELFLTDRMSLVKDAESTDSYGGVSILASTTVSYTTGWYEVEVDWRTDNSIFVSLFDGSGSLVATTSASDASYTSGGYGFTYWGFNGGWDSFTARNRTDSTPAVYFGAEQGDGGATWAAPQDTAIGGFVFGETARLRIAIENSGLDIENQQFQLEFAPKLTAPTCQAVSGGSFSAVPTAAGCGSSAVCMTASTTVSNGDPTTDHLAVTGGDFVAGEIIEGASNQTGSLDINQNQYTELEYAINLTANATNDAYCFRVTDGGSVLDSYARLPELTLAFDPIVSGVTLNNGADINLTLGTTTRVYATGTVTDFNGYADLSTATATIYRSGAGAACSADNNNCYISAGAPQCTFTGCAGSSCTLSCYADIYYHADPTDSGSAFDGQEWLAYVEVEDMSGGYDFGSALGVEMMTLRALEVDTTINYGTLDVNQNSGSTNADTTLYNLGNEAIDVRIAGTDMTDGAASVIDASEQVFATSTFDYETCTNCSSLSVLGSDLEVDLTKPATTSPPVTDEVYWGINIPFGTASKPHTGNNTFMAIGD